LERSEDILIVTHQAVLRCIYAYFMQKSQVESPWMNVPLHTLIKLTPRAYGTQEERYDARIPAVSTWRGKGSVAKHEDPVETTVSLGEAKDDAEKELKEDGTKYTKNGFDKLAVDGSTDDKSKPASSIDAST